MTDQEWMKRCLELAQKASAEDEVPVGAIIVKDGKILAEGYNRREQDSSVLAHAELIAIHEATQKLKTWRLEGCTLYASLEPCVMCSGAIVQARIPKVVYGADDPKAGGQTLFELLNHSKLNHRAEIVKGVLADECGSLLTNFFKKKRQSQT